MVGILRRTSVDGESVVGTIDGSPVVDVGLEACFDFPILYEVLDEVGQAGCFVAFRFG